MIMESSLKNKINELLRTGVTSADIHAVLTREYPNYSKRQPIVPSIPSREELIRILISFHPEPVIERYQKQSLAGKSAKEILLFTMDSSIYRAFHHETPSQRFKKCRWHSDPDDLIKNLENISDQKSFDNLAFLMGETLVTDWGTINDIGVSSKMNIGIAMKITNLALKHLSFSGLCVNPDLPKYLHVPWDSFTLKPLRHIWIGNPAIPNDAGQGFVKNLIIYQALHALISDISQEAGVSRIIYELWAWDAAH
jgi:hypothetical protein